MPVFGLNTAEATQSEIMNTAEATHKGRRIMPKKKKDANTVPPAVAKQAKAAEDAQKKLRGEDPAAEPTPAQEPAPAAAPAQEPAPVEPAADPTPVQPAVDPNLFVPPAIADPGATDDYKSKYDVLKGKYDAEVPALKGEVESLKHVMANMQQALETQAQAAAVSTPARVESGLKALNSDNYSEYGDEIVKLAEGFNALLAHNEQLAAQIANGSGAPSELVQRTERLEATVQKTNEDRYYDDLTRLVPDWRTINRSAAFDQWLREVDPISMAARLDILQYAAANLNAQQVINIFNQFKADSGMTPAAAADPAPTPTVVNEHLSGQIMPEANLSNPNEMQPSGAQIQYPTQAEFKQASHDFITKKITEEQYNDISNRYQLAIKAGKVVQ